MGMGIEYSEKRVRPGLCARSFGQLYVCIRVKTGGLAGKRGNKDHERHNTAYTLFFLSLLFRVCGQLIVKLL